MLTFALNSAKTLGYQQVILQASEDGLRIYEKVGFQKFGLYYEYA
jgi:predicted acetyltransferase